MLTTIFYILLFILYIIFGYRLIIQLLLWMLISYWLCDITPNETYSWYSGIWHGMFFVPNFLRSLHSNTLYKAEYYTTAYNIWWWSSTIVLTISFIFGEKGNNRYYR